MKIEINAKLVYEGEIKPNEKIEIRELSEGFYLYGNDIVSNPPMLPIDFFDDGQHEIGIWFDDDKKLFVFTILEKKFFRLKVYVSKFNARKLKEFI